METPFDKIKVIYLKSEGLHNCDSQSNLTAKEIGSPLVEADDYEHYFDVRYVNGSNEENSEYEE